MSAIPEVTAEIFVEAIASRGPKPILRKPQVTLRLDAYVIEWFRAQGTGYQAKINRLLRADVDEQRSR